jgi:hypothetical protein
MSFAEIVEEIQSLQKDEKIELKNLIDKYLIDENRDDIFQNFIASRNEISSEQLKYYKNSKDLRRALDSD